MLRAIIRCLSARSNVGWSERNHKGLERHRAGVIACEGSIALASDQESGDRTPGRGNTPSEVGVLGAGCAASVADAVDLKITHGVLETGIVAPRSPLLVLMGVTQPIGALPRAFWRE